MSAKGFVSKRCGCTDKATGKQYGQKCPELKRSNGSYNPRHGSWYFSVGITIKGRRKQVLRAGFESKEEAQKALDKLKADHKRGRQVTIRLTVRDYLREWLKGKNDIRPNTRHSYTSQIERYIIPELGHILLDDLRTSDVRSMLDTVKQSSATVQRVRACLRTALNDAIREGLMSSNPASNVKLPKTQQSRPLVWTEERVTEYTTSHHKPSAVMVWTPTQLGHFLDSIHTHRLYALFWLLSHRGLRRGEALGLEWSDLDLTNGTATILRQVVSTSGRVYEQEPKSAAGGRVIALGTLGVETIKAHRKRQAAEDLARPSGRRSTKVFSATNGHTLSPMNVTHLFTDLVKASELPPVRLHDLRHTAASLMLASGSDLKVVQETLGHSNLALTGNVYTSVYRDVATASADAVSAIVPRSS
jgi:site-specific recombinase XerD